MGSTAIAFRSAFFSFKASLTPDIVPPVPRVPITAPVIIEKNPGIVVVSVTGSPVSVGVSSATQF